MRRRHGGDEAESVVAIEEYGAAQYDNQVGGRKQDGALGREEYKVGQCGGGHGSDEAELVVAIEEYGTT